MSNSAQRTAVPAVVGHRVVSAYIFRDELDAHGVVLGLDDGSDISIEFNYETRVAAAVLRSRADDDEGVVLSAAG